MLVHREPRMRGNALLRVAGCAHQIGSRPLRPSDAFLSLYTDGTHTIVRTPGGRWTRLPEGATEPFGRTVVHHHSRLPDGSARVIVIEDQWWEWGVQLEPRFYYNLAKVGAGSALFRSHLPHRRTL